MTAATSTPTVYTGRATNWPMVVVETLLCVPLVAASRASGDDWRVFVVTGSLFAVGIMLNVLTASSVRVSAGPQGVRIHWGALGWPRMHYRLADLTEVDVVRVPWSRVTFGWWWTPWRTTCTTRAGETLQLVLTSGRVVTVTVPDPHAAVAALGFETVAAQPPQPPIAG